MAVPPRRPRLCQHVDQRGRGLPPWGHRPRTVIERATNASSPDSSSSPTNRSTAPRASTIASPRILSLESSTTPRLTGTRSSVNWVIGSRDAVLVDLEIVAGEAGDQASGAVADRDGNGNGGDAGSGIAGPEPLESRENAHTRLTRQQRRPRQELQVMFASRTGQWTHCASGDQILSVVLVVRPRRHRV